MLHLLVDCDPEVEFTHETVDETDGPDVETWLEEMGYQWTGDGWLMEDEEAD